MKQTDQHPQDGPHREVFTDGTLAAEGTYQSGKKHGRWQYFYKNGQPKAIGEYVGGELYGQWEWWRANAQPFQAGAFELGVQVGT